MRRFQSGDEESFRALFDRYATRLVNFAYRFLGSREESEDISQEVLLRIHRGKDRYDSSRPFRPWLFFIASRLISNRLRDRKRHPHVFLDLKPDDDFHENTIVDLPDKALSLPEETLQQRQLVQDTQKALEVLPENQRTAILLARFEEMSYEEIAQTMNISAPAVKSLLFRARQTLQRILLPHVSIKKGS